MTFITGNTYINRNAIKALGFSWNKNGKTWVRIMPITPDEEATLSELKGIAVANGNGLILDTRAPMTYKERYGRCEDAPCCGCCGPQFY